MSPSHDPGSQNRRRFHSLHRHSRPLERWSRLIYPLLLAVLPRPDSRGADFHFLPPLVGPPAAKRADERPPPMKVLNPNFEPHLSPIEGINIAILLECLADCESRSNDSAIGRRGERGRYQIRRGTWLAYGVGEFETQAHKYPAATACATRYLISLGRTLRDHKITPSVLALATLWNRGTLFYGPNDFAVRVTNLYNDAIKSQATFPPPPSVPPSNHR